MRRTKIFISSIAAVLMIIALYSTAGAATHTGTVIETASGGGYTYMHIDESGKKFWIAGPQAPIKKGTEVSFSEQVWMSNFNSKALGRTFDRILFVNGVEIASAKAKVKVASSKGADTGAAKKYTIKDIFANKKKLKGQMIRVSGKVVKVSEGIMGHNWVHVKDGTGDDGANKVIFRSKNETASVGDAVTAQGRLETDVDFGFGYFYKIIIEDSSFKK